MSLFVRPQLDDPVRNEQAGIVHITLVICTLTLGGYLLYQIITPAGRQSLIYTVPNLLVYVGAFWLLSRGRVLLAGAITVAFLTVLLSVLAVFAGGYESGVVQMLVVCSLLGSLLVHPRAGMALTAWAVAVQVAVGVWGSSDALLTAGYTTSSVPTTVVQTALLGILVSIGVGEMRRVSRTASDRARDLALATQASHTAVQQAESANRAKSVFLANMSHELRTPLNAILGYSEMLIEELGGEQAEDADRIRRAGAHLLSLIDDVLDMSKVEAGRMELDLEPVHLPTLLQDAANTISPTAQKNHNAVTLDVSLDRATLWLDARKTQQILMNLLSNACKFTEQGTITIEAKGDDQGVKLAVHDTGMGIPRDKLSLLFQPFVQAHDARRAKVGGTGLGLTLSRRFAEMMHGTLDVISTEGVGSTFTLWLPDLSRWGSQADAGDGPVILCVDEDVATLELVARVLRAEGYRTARAMTVAQADHHAARLTISAVLMDLTLPDGTGWAALDRVRTRQPRVPAVIASAMEPEDHAPVPLVVDYLIKPIQPNALIVAIESALGTEVASADVVPHLLSTH